MWWVVVDLFIYLFLKVALVDGIVSVVAVGVCGNDCWWSLLRQWSLLVLLMMMMIGKKLIYHFNG